MTKFRLKRIHAALVALFVVASCNASTRYAQCTNQFNPFAELGPYTRDSVIPVIGGAEGNYTKEFRSSTVENVSVNAESLPRRPYLGTELYWENPDSQEEEWFKQLGLDFLRVEVTPKEIVASDQGNSRLPASFTDWTADDFENGKGWSFGHSASSVTNILENSYGVRFPLMLMIQAGGESYMGLVPDSEDYADYFLATVYYYNVIKGMNLKYWEVLNEPDWGYNNAHVSPDQYAAIFKRVVARIKNFPDKRVNSISLGGPVLGSGDPIDGSWPDGYANRDSDQGRQWRDYVPTLLDKGSRDGHCDVGFLSWHDYGSDTWKTAASIYDLSRTYALANRVEAFAKYVSAYTSGGSQLPLVVSEMNFAAGETLPDTKARFKNFYSALWHASALNNYFSTGKVTMISHFFWKGDNSWPKGLVYRDTDSGNQLVRTPVWWMYREYIRHTESRILASFDGRQNAWADAVATTDDKGQVMYLIAVNKGEGEQQIDFSFNVPESLLGPVVISKERMHKAGDGEFGDPFMKPALIQDYAFQSTFLENKKQVRYIETLPPRSIVFYTVIPVKQ